MPLIFHDSKRRILGYGFDTDQEVVSISKRGEDAHAAGLGTYLAFNAAAGMAPTSL
jgi:hypothetical protein